MSTENPVVQTIQAEITRVEQEQQPIRDQIAQLEQQLTEGNEVVARYRQAMNALTGTFQSAPALQRSSRPSTNGRASRGSNVHRILEYVKDRPGASTAQVSESLGLAKNTTASTLQKLATDGRLERVDLGGGRRGFKTPDSQ